jgi:hypothetical protein
MHFGPKARGGETNGFDSGADATARDRLLATYASRPREAEPLSIDQERHEIRRMLQDMMSRSTNELLDSPRKKAGWERPCPDRDPTPDRNTCQKLRYDNPVRPREIDTSSHESSYRARQNCRFHESPSNRQLLRVRSADSGGLRQRSKQADASSAAGRASDSHLRHDTPGGQDRSLGRVRSLTPDYYRKYATNVGGSSLPGSWAAGQGSGETPRSVRSLRRQVAYDPRSTNFTASVKDRHECRYFSDVPEDMHNYGRRRRMTDFVGDVAARSPRSDQDSARSVGSAPVVVPLLSSVGMGSGSCGSPAVTQWQNLAAQTRPARLGASATDGGRQAAGWSTKNGDKEQSPRKARLGTWGTARWNAAADRASPRFSPRVSQCAAPPARAAPPAASIGEGCLLERHNRPQRVRLETPRSDSGYSANSRGAN